jgi:hypothetical protein
MHFESAVVEAKNASLEIAPLLQSKYTENIKIFAVFLHQYITYIFTLIVVQQNSTYGSN